MSNSLPPTIQRRARRVALAWLVVMEVAAFTMLALLELLDWRLAGIDGTGLLIAMVYAQVNGLCFWIVFAPFGALTRWLQSVAAAVVLLVCALLGLAVVGLGDSWMREIKLLVLWTPLFLTVASWPLWILRLAGGFRLSAAGQTPETETASRRQYSIADLLAVMAVVALSLGLARTAVSLEDRFAQAPDDAQMIEAFRNAVVIAFVVGIWTALTAIPCAWAALVAKRRLRAAALLAAYVPLFVVGVWCWGYWRSRSRFFDATAAVMGVSVLAIVFLSLWALRLSGVVLRRQRRKRPPSAAVDKADEHVA